MTFGQNLKDFRHRKNISQTKLFLKTGFPQTTISDWENDKYLPNIVEAQKLAKALGVRLSKLLRDKFDFPKYEVA
jgi:transcriptional regulator with XRE-family HTH domain